MNQQILKPIPEKIIDKFLMKICKDICEKYDLEMTFINSSSVKQINIFFDQDVKKVNTNEVEKMFREKFFELGDFIKKEMNVDMKEYNRNLTVEHTIDNNQLSVFWR